jgi:hypothetical protein
LSKIPLCSISLYFHANKRDNLLKKFKVCQTENKNIMVLEIVPRFGKMV